MAPVSRSSFATYGPQKFLPAQNLDRSADCSFTRDGPLMGRGHWPFLACCAATMKSAGEVIDSAHLSFAKTRSTPFPGGLLRDVALFLPFGSNKERQMAAKAGTRRRRKNGGHYDG